MKQVLLHLLAGSSIALSLVVGNLSSKPTPVFSDQNQYTLTEGRVAIEYHKNGAGLAFAVGLFGFGVTVELSVAKSSLKQDLPEQEWYTPAPPQQPQQPQRSQAPQSVQPVQPLFSLDEEDWLDTEGSQSVEKTVSTSTVVYGGNNSRVNHQSNPVPSSASSKPVSENIPPVAANLTQTPVRTMLEVEQDAEDKERDSWLNTFLYKDNGELRQHHWYLKGPTQSGKTTLGEEIIKRIGQGAEDILLLNPKHIPSRPAWSIKPYCSDIEEALKCVTQFSNKMKEKLRDPEFDLTTASHRFFIIDEHDWIYEEYAKAYISKLRSLFKVGAEILDHVLLSGQSSLLTDVGLSGGDARQFGQIILNAEVLAFFSNTQNVFQDMTKDLKAKAMRFHEKEQRFALVIPATGLPGVYLVPDLSKKTKSKPPANVVAFPQQLSSPAL